MNISETLQILLAPPRFWSVNCQPLATIMQSRCILVSRQNNLAANCRRSTLTVTDGGSSGTLVSLQR